MLLNDMGYAHLATKSTHPKHRHVALLFSQGTLLVWANNTKQMHAEERVITIAKMLNFNLKKDMTLISIAIRKDGKLKLGKPCAKCQAKIKQSKIKNVLYSTCDQKIIRS